MFRLNPGMIGIMNRAIAAVAKALAPPATTMSVGQTEPMADGQPVSRKKPKRSTPVAFREIWKGGRMRSQWLHPTKGWRFG